MTNMTQYNKGSNNNYICVSLSSLLSLLASVLPADVDGAVLFEQDVSDLLAVEQQVVLDVLCLGVGGLLRLLLRVVSGETHLEVAQSTAGHKALQLLSEQRWGGVAGKHFRPL